MTRLLRGDEVLACEHRVALSRGAPTPVPPADPTPEAERRRRRAAEHRRGTLDALAAAHPGSPVPASVDQTTELLAAGAELVLRPRLAPDVAGRRVSFVQALLRVGRDADGYRYAPLIVKNCEVVEASPTRRTLEASLAEPFPAQAQWADGLGLRSSAAVTRAAVLLDHATRVLEALGRGDPRARGGLVDRQGRLWWLPLAGDDYPRVNLRAYDAHYSRQLAVLEAHERYAAGEGPFPTEPYWHRDCPDCPYAPHCEAELEARDDVSLTRFTTRVQQLALREHGVATRASLARLDPARARSARSRLALEATTPEDHLGRTIDKLDELIYRARVHERGVPARAVDRRQMGCPTADVEVDVDMESYEDVTYLWGATVTLRAPVPGLADGYVGIARWHDLSAAGEAELFAEFWSWFTGVRELCATAGASFAAYCFWARAEDTAMNRAVEAPVAGGPTRADVDAFRADPTAWVDLHDLAKRQIQTEGPLGLKLLAQASGFAWRDPSPSGEASMLWYEVARGRGPEAEASRARLLAYNEDDCRATRALREWLNGPARDLPHRDDPVDAAQ